MVIEDFNRIKEQLGFEEGIHGKEEYFNSVVLVLLMPVNGEYHFVFQKRAANIRQAGEICFPGGKIDETDTSLEQVALRETYEEMGIPADKIEIIGRINTLVAPMGVTVDAFVGIADVSLDELAVNESEVERVITLPVTYFLNNQPDRYNVKIEVHPTTVDEKSGKEIVLLPVEELRLPAIYKNSWGNYLYKVLVYKTDQGVIWGITARIVHEVARKIEKIKNEQ
jgi:8-oxo-dGTP pyrophosphatase MutT (NUDIX family)